MYWDGAGVIGVYWNMEKYALLYHVWTGLGFNLQTFQAVCIPEDFRSNLFLGKQTGYTSLLHDVMLAFCSKQDT